MRYCSIASGSSGNCHYVEAGGVRVLVDQGLTLKAAENNMRSVGLDPASVQAIFVTHEHSDHIRGVGPWARKYGVPIFATEGTWQGMEKTLGRVDLPKCYTIRPGKGYRMAGLRIEPFLIYHDANEPVGYSFTTDNEKLVILTDTGMVSSEIRTLLGGSRLIVVEANHDIEMLMGGPYPLALKRRIRSNLGHLSNEDCAWLVAELLPDNPGCRFILAHLSDENNKPEVALQTVLDTLRSRYGEGIYPVSLARRDLPTEVFSTDEPEQLSL
ncbi:MAG: MBL fold metallo-hydrolase [Firmicutes bacterium]|nr:MBL fold metallo-hydrolase [Bacillota bacterium]